jgi:hypothetical protein
MHHYPLTMQNMIQAYLEKPGNMIVIETVKDLPSLFARADKTHLAQPAQLVRNCRFRYVNPICDFAHAHFALQQGGNNREPRWITEGAEQVSQMDGGSFVDWHRLYMSSCSYIHNYPQKGEICQVTIL